MPLPILSFQADLHLTNTRVLSNIQQFLLGLIIIPLLIYPRIFLIKKFFENTVAALVELTGRDVSVTGRI
jgi:hypothetical protein